MRKIALILFFFACLAVAGFADSKSFLLDDFQGDIHGGAMATIDYGAGGGSSIEVSPEFNIKYSGTQSLKVVYDAVAGGYIWIARGYGLDALQAGWPKKPEEIDWVSFNAIAFYAFGSNSGNTFAFDIKDKGNEVFRFTFKDDFTGWKQISCRFNDFYPREDWQPNDATRNATVDFPLKSFQFEPLAPGKGTIYFDRVELINKD